MTILDHFLEELCVLHCGQTEALPGWKSGCIGGHFCDTFLFQTVNVLQA